ncbi:MAG TPA: DNA polymerase III subunit alpha [Pseudomonadales bacterium]|nr:DNA polymerase III subunit alpha [Pseudomonadales bacterium]
MTDPADEAQRSAIAVNAPAPAFVHLRVHSEFSLVDGLVKIKDLVRRTAERGMAAVALTDQSNLFALVKFYSAALDAGIKPIAGCDLWVEGVEEGGEPARLTLLIQDAKGYRNLTELVSRSYVEGQRQHRAIVHRAWFEGRTEGLIALSGGRDGEVAQALAGGHDGAADAVLTHWMGLFPDRFYLELTRTGRRGEDLWVEAAVELAARHDCPVVATNDVRFVDADDFEAHEARVCIHDSRVLGDPRRPRTYSEQQYLRTPAEMAALFDDLPEALENSVEIARRCTLDLILGKNFLPEYPIPEGETLASFFGAESYRGLEARLERILDAEAPDYAERRAEYVARLEFELKIILQMDFPGYFLIVAEFIGWAKANDIPVGPGRGSGAGSLVAYALGITDLDPLAYDLLFERFLNPERVSMPDFDVDFCMEGRDRVIAHVAELYGKEAVSQIVTYGTMAAKAVVRDVARVQGKPYGLADKLSKLIPFEVGMTLEKAMAQEEALRSFVAESEEVGEIMEMAFKLEGLVRNIGRHAGGVVIAPGRLTDFVPLVADESGSLMTQFDKDDVEKAGLVKFDFLGLRTLTIIDWALKAVNELRRAAGEDPIAIEDIPLDDPAVFSVLQKAETTAIFQLESRGMKDLIKRQRPDCFEDIVALVALFRPGPLQSGMVDDFIDRKHGRSKVTYAHPDLEPILENTYGVILYQEQVMQIAQVLARYTLGGADLLRRAMGKKKPEEMAKQREIFMHGAGENDIDASTATYIFDLMEKFAGYGFNKSHSAAYALVSYQTAWLKTHYPGAFMAAVLSADMQTTDKIVTLIEECREMKLGILPPDVNRSGHPFTATPPTADSPGDVVYGLGAIKGVGEGPVEGIVAAREADGPFRDIFDLCRRVDPRRLNKRVLEALIRAGALDTLAPVDADGAPHRAALVAAIDDALKTAEQAAHNDEIGMTDLFGGLDATADDTTPTALPDVRPFTQPQRLVGEKETLGLYLTGHPIDSYEREIRQFAPTPIRDLRADRNVQVVAGLIVDHRVIRTKRGDPIAFVTLDDRSARIEVVVSADLLDACREKLGRDRLVVVEGEVGVDDYSGGMRVRRAHAVYTVTEARQRYATALDISIDGSRVGGEFSDRLRRVLASYRGDPGRPGSAEAAGLPVAIRYCGRGAEARLRLGNDWRVEPSDDLLQRLRDELQADDVGVRYQGDGGFDSRPPERARATGSEGGRRGPAAASRPAQRGGAAAMDGAHVVASGAGRNDTGGL